MRCRSRLLLLFVALAAISLTQGALAQTTARSTTNDAQSAPAPTTPLTVRVESIEGAVQYRASSKDRWRAPRIGQSLPAGVEFRTGLRSSVKVRIGTAQVVTLGRHTRAVVGVAAKQDGVERTRINLPMGKLDFDVNSKRVANDLQVRTPDNVLAVRGTEGGVMVQGSFATVAYGGRENTGLFTVAYVDGVTASISRDEQSTSLTPDPAAKLDNDILAATSNVNLTTTPDEIAVISRSAAAGDRINISVGVTDRVTTTTNKTNQTTTTGNRQVTPGVNSGSPR